MSEITTEILIQRGWKKVGEFWEHPNYKHQGLPFCFTEEDALEAESLPKVQKTLDEWARTTGGILVAIKVENGENFAQIDKDGHPHWTPIPNNVIITGKDLRAWLII